MAMFGDSRIGFHLEEDKLMGFALQYPRFYAIKLYVCCWQICYYVCIASKAISVQGNHFSKAPLLNKVIRFGSAITLPQQEATSIIILLVDDYWIKPSQHKPKTRKKPYHTIQNNPKHPELQRFKLKAFLHTYLDPNIGA
jgi:hypothetical protein